MATSIYRSCCEAARGLVDSNRHPALAAELHLAGVRARRLESSLRPLVKTLRAGERFLSQSSKWLHFGISQRARIDRVIDHWPGGSREKFAGVRAGGRCRIVQGSGTTELWTAPNRAVDLTPSELSTPTNSDQLQAALAGRVPMSLVPYQDFEGKQHEPVGDAGRPVLLNLWASWCQPCLAELGEFARHEDRLRASGLNIVGLSVDSLGDTRSVEPTQLKVLLARLNYPFAAGMANERLTGKLELLYATLFNTQVALPVPASFLIGAQGSLTQIYLGPVKVERLLSDLENLTVDDEQRR